MAGYSRLDKLLHRLALQMTPVAEMSFDLDQKMVDTDPADIVQTRHVFVAGLARAGTTVLMRRFHASGAFRSLTYRDMPFVLAPNRWRALSSGASRDIKAGERAHGDGLVVDADSPEALEEAFWRIFHGSDYIRKTRLVPHNLDQEDRDRFRAYVNAILAAQDGTAGRYLSKNNNNILRLPTVSRSFPNALILVPFRTPAAHAGSLLRQHRLFGQMQADDPFVRRYMGWLAHHEFGLDHRPFRFGDDAPDGPPAGDADGLEYWLTLWCDTYEALEKRAPEQAVFVCYEDLCADPAVWNALAEAGDVPPDLLETEALEVRNDPGSVLADTPAARRASDLYDRLRARSRRFHS